MIKNYVAIENASNAATVALLRFKKGLPPRVYVERNSSTEQQAESIFSMLDELLTRARIKRKNLHGIIFSQGPGAFTGLRVSCGVAQGLALGLGLKVVPISSLEATAQMNRDLAHADDFIVPILDARMREVFIAVYKPLAPSEGGGLETIVEPTLMAAEQALAWLRLLRDQRGLAERSFLLCGNALIEYPTDFMAADQIHFGRTEWPDAGVLARMGYKRFGTEAVIEPDLATPIYLRDKVAFTTEEREQGMGGNPQANVPGVKTVTRPKTALELLLETKNIRIRPMTQDDVIKVAQIELEIQPEPWSISMFSDSLQANYSASVLILPSGQIGGYVLQMMAPDMAHLLLIGVSAAYQGQGLGKLLLQWSEQMVLQNGLSKQLLEVRSSNIVANQLYQNRGYYQVGIRKGYYKDVTGRREDAIVMIKDL